ncbi:hypothetical protein BH09DEP1_BH09DEP1_6280 [soil metagenome]
MKKVATLLLIATILECCISLDAMNRPHIFRSKTQSALSSTKLTKEQANQEWTKLLVKLLSNRLSSSVRKEIPHLIAAGANVNQADPFRGETMLMKAVVVNDLETARLLLQAGADIDKQDHLGITALRLAIGDNKSQMVRLLIDAGADLDKKDYCNGSGYTALMRAAEYGHLEIVRLLLDGGADRTLTNQAGETAKDIALKYHHQEIAKLLTELSKIK